MSTIVQKNVSELKPHPRNEEIYGTNESIDELVETMRKSGIVTTLTITDNNVIIAGHRRWKSCKQLIAEGDKRFCAVNCEVKEFDNEWEELEYLVINNNSREKTMEQKAREAQMLLKAEKELGKKRMSQGGKGGIVTSVEGVAESPPLNQGKARDIVAKKLKMKSGREVERAVKSVETIDKLTETGRKDDADLIRDTLNNKSISAASDLAYNIDKLTEEEKQAIRDKKISAYKAVSKYATKSVPKIKDNMTPEMKKKLAHQQTCKEAVEEYIARSMGLIDVSDISVDDNTDDLIAFFESSVSTFTAAITNLIDNTSKFSWNHKERISSIANNAENKLNELKKTMEESNNDSERI